MYSKSKRYIISFLFRQFTPTPLCPGPKRHWFLFGENKGIRNNEIVRIYLSSSSDETVNKSESVRWVLLKLIEWTYSKTITLLPLRPLLSPQQQPRFS